MKVPKEIRTYCPHCRAHTVHKVKMPKKGKARGMAWGTLRHERRTKGYVGKVKGQANVKKQAKRQRIILECTQCKKKQERVLGGGRTKKKVEIMR
ncbi:MAG: 50S ribosomal protein L44e [Candidatus Asgardarchaeia archaeon]